MMRPRGPEFLLQKASLQPRRDLGCVWGRVEQHWVWNRIVEGSERFFSPTDACRKPRKSTLLSRKDKLSIPAVPCEDPGSDLPGSPQLGNGPVLPAT